MNYKDWALYYLVEFQRVKHAENLEKGLRYYNRIIGSTLSLRKILEISQYVTEAYKIGKHEDIEKLDYQIGRMKGDLQSGEIHRANDDLVDLSEVSMSVVSKHKEKLGFGVKYPYTLILRDQAKDVITKIFPQFIGFLLWIAVLVILAYLGIIHVIFPP